MQRHFYDQTNQGSPSLRLNNALDCDMCSLHYGHVQGWSVTFWISVFMGLSFGGWNLTNSCEIPGADPQHIIHKSIRWKVIVFKTVTVHELTLLWMAVMKSTFARLAKDFPPRHYLISTKYRFDLTWFETLAYLSWSEASNTTPEKKKTNKK